MKPRINAAPSASRMSINLPRKTVLSARPTTGMTYSHKERTERYTCDMPTKSNMSKELPIQSFKTQADWAVWLEGHYAASKGLWLRLAKKTSGVESVNYTEALDVALCYGWIDSQKKSYDDATWLQKFTPRSKKSIWSKVNRDRVVRLTESGRMHAAGLAEVAHAQHDGRWDAAYESQRKAAVPDDLQAALDKNKKAKVFFATLKGSNRYAVLFRIYTAKKPETRAKRIAQFIEMLSKGEMLHP